MKFFDDLDKLEFKYDGWPNRKKQKAHMVVPTIPAPTSARNTQNILAAGDYVLCTEDIPALDGTGDMICKKGQLYLVVDADKTWVELTVRPGCRITKSAFKKCHLQIVKNS